MVERSHARVVIVGGGVAGTALAYQLTLLGCTEVVLLEKGELTCGSTWHAAGNVPFLMGGVSASRLHRRSLGSYAALARHLDRSLGLHHSGSVKIATSRTQMDENRRHAAMLRMTGIRCELIGPGELETLFPYLALDQVVGAAWTPEDGHLDPSSLTFAQADAARANGALIRRHTSVNKLARNPAGAWLVETHDGTIQAEHVVNAGGLHAREVSRMTGHALPAVPMERQYLVTEDVPGIESLPHELPVLRDISAPMYIRQEGRSLLLGLYDQAPVFWALEGTPASFEQALLSPDFDRVERSLTGALARIPVLNEVGIKTRLNGPLMRTPDAQPLVGPVAGLERYWLNTGYFAGIAQAGGCAEILARWILDGHPDEDVSLIDARRFGGYADQTYTMTMTRAAYRHEFSVARPHEHLHADGQPRRALVDPLQESFAAGASHGWPVQMWFGECDAQVDEDSGFARPQWLSPVRSEVVAVLEGAGIMDLSALSRIEVLGSESRALLEAAGITGVTDSPGESTMALCHDHRQRLAGLALVSCVTDERYLVSAPSALEGVLMQRLLAERVPGSVVDNITDRSATLLLSGPRASRLMERVDELGWTGITVRPATLTDDDVELHGDSMVLARIRQDLLTMGSESPTAFGWHAFNALRLRSGKLRWGVELAIAGSGRTDGFVLLRVPVEADNGEMPAGAEPLWLGDKVIGATTSAGVDETGNDAWVMASVDRAVTPDDGLIIELGETRIPAEVQRCELRFMAR